MEAAALPSLLDAYLADCQIRIDPAAVKNYTNHLRPFREWWSRFAANYDYHLSRTSLQAFVDWLASDYRTVYGQKVSPYAIAKAIALVRRFLRWCHQVGAVEQDISELVPDFETPHPGKYYPAVDELDAILKAPVDDHLRLRDTAIMAMLIATGARRFEIANAKIEHLTFATPIENITTSADHSGHVHLRVVKGDNTGNGPGRHAVFDGKAGLLTKAYLRLTGKRSGSIFGLLDDGIRKIVHDAGERAGFPQIHPHAFRSAFVDWWFWKNHKHGNAADMALRLQVGHALNSGDAQTHYINRGNPARIIELIRSYYTSPLEEITIDWARYPVHIER